MKFKEKSYYIIVITISLVLFLLINKLNVDYFFSLFYEINYQGINNTLLTIYGILFAFIFTMMALLFSLRKDSYFVKLIEENHRNKKDVINYFIWAIISVILVLVVSMFLNVTYLGLNANVTNGLASMLNSINSLNHMLVLILIYLVAFSVVNISLLFLTFLIIIKK